MFKDNDFVYIDYVSKIKDTGEIIDTTIEEEAKKQTYMIQIRNTSLC